MRKLISISMVTVLVAVLLALTPGLAMADESDVSLGEVVLWEYLEEATSIQLATGEVTATVSSACVTSGTVSADFGLIVTDVVAFPGVGFHEADFSATLDGRSYSGAMRGMHMIGEVEEDLMEMWGKFYDSNHNRLEGCYHALVRYTGEWALELMELEITWKDYRQCYCELNVDSIDFNMEVVGEVAASVEYIDFDFDGDSTGHYTGTFAGMGVVLVWEGLGQEAWHEKGIVALYYGTDTGWGNVYAYATLDFKDPGDPPGIPIEKELSFLGVILEEDPVGLDGSVNGGDLYVTIFDPEEIHPDIGGGGGSFDVRHTHSGPCPLADGGGGGGGGGGFCFIATAAYGSYLDSHVQTLRDFRDQYLETNPVGSALVSAYYELSPPVAEFIDDHPALKPIVRAGLMPAVAMSTVAVNTTLAEKIAMVSGLALVSLALGIWLRRRAARKMTY